MDFKRVKISSFIACIGLTLILATLPACSNKVNAGDREHTVLDTQIGDATFYARSFQGDMTASGRKFDNRRAFAAHGSYPFGTVARVTNLSNGRSLNVVIVDRGPYGKNRREGAIIDLSRITAARLGIIRQGQARVRVEVLQWGDGTYSREHPQNR
ncbi:MAG TPA: septal ring lytic transglycosylase RlpA family protein [Terriglobia bacterium]|nr:septal ring lytic transglycosylase RlpA family protein [Terriglobia bacterium]